MSMDERIKNIELVYKECLNCFTIYPIPVKIGCSICPTCGQRSCSE